MELVKYKLNWPQLRTEYSGAWACLATSPGFLAALVLWVTGGLTKKQGSPVVKGESLWVVIWPWASHFISLSPDFLPFKTVIKFCWVIVQLNEIAQCSDYGGCEHTKATAGQPRGSGNQRFSLGRRFKFSFNTFTVVCASNLKALVCPFSRYSLSTLGIHSREFPWKTKGQCWNWPFLPQWQIFGFPWPCLAWRTGSSLTSSPCYG